VNFTCPLCPAQGLEPGGCPPAPRLGRRSPGNSQPDYYVYAGSLQVLVHNAGHTAPDGIPGLTFKPKVAQIKATSDNYNLDINLKNEPDMPNFRETPAFDRSSDGIRFGEIGSGPATPRNAPS